MPIVKVFRDQLYDYLGQTFTEHEFEDLCFKFGVELDEVTSDKQMAQKMRGEAVSSTEEIASSEVIYKIDVPANRYDLLCMESIARAFKIFLGNCSNPEFKVVVPEGDNLIHMVQHPETASVRPFILCAVLRGVQLNQGSYDSLMALQEKLHENIGRHRSLVAIGTHDLDTLSPPFSYEARPFADINFAPLGETKEYNVNTLFEHYRTSENKKHLRPFLKLTDSSPVHPVIYDSKGTVLSLPPIINGDHSKITLNTTNIFIEMTGTDLTKLNITMDMVVSAFSEYCSTPFTIEGVSVERKADPSWNRISPSLKKEEFKGVSVEYINNLVGIDWAGEDMAAQLAKMQMPAVFRPETNTLDVTVPHTRPDILHICDIAEDVAIVFGYDNIKKVLPPCMTVGGQVPLNHLTDLNRDIYAQAGFTEVLTWVLCNRDDNFKKINHKDDGKCVLIATTRKGQEFNAVRTTLIPGLLQVISNNQGEVKLPMRVFEAGDVCLLDDDAETGARNERRIAAMFCARNSGVEEIHALLDRVMKMNNCTFIPGSGEQAQALLTAAKNGAKPVKNNISGIQKQPYFLLASENETYLDLRRADVYISGHQIGSFGIVHPTVLAAFGIDYPCSVLELNLELFL